MNENPSTAWKMFVVYAALKSLKFKKKIKTYNSQIYIYAAFFWKADWMFHHMLLFYT